MIYEMKNPQMAEDLFKGWQETLIWSCLQGVMGKIYGNDQKTPESAAAMIGDFCFLQGNPLKSLWHLNRKTAERIL